MKQDWTDIVNEIEALKAERDALREALKPFAREAENWGNSEHDSNHPACDISGSACTHCGNDPEYGRASFTVGDLRIAHTCLKQGKKSTDGEK